MRLLDVLCVTRWHDQRLVRKFRQFAAIATRERDGLEFEFFGCRIAAITFADRPLVLIPSTTSPGAASACTCRAKTSAYPTSLARR